MTSSLTPATPAAVSTHAHHALGHSEEYFRAYRDFWWNADFLQLIAKRWQLQHYRSVLDVGCGQCHWSRLLLPYLAEQPQITGLDSDIKWSQGNLALQRQFAEQGASLVFSQGDAACLPYADNSFDLVTCQTVLIHLPDPLAALREMHRVAKPGGRVICAEPSNLANAGMASALEAGMTPAERLAAYRYRLLCETGKRLVGEGYSSLGDGLASLFRQAGFAEVQSYLSDKASPVLAPYGGKEAQADLAELCESMLPERVALWNSHVARWATVLSREDADFVQAYAADVDTRHARLRALLETGRYWYGGAAVMYLVSAVKGR
ncbi:class I SAM-dependent methyltransferase [Chitinimonas sp. JJ19]|uniref:class I SAM-dependent methyltransferase n=1 Tax=Chitinimonas sp. JJ19 TaxID=3109352 RepID=UPI003002478F